jgi:type III secretory pathway component EscU
MPINPEICQTSGEKGKRQMIQKEVSSISAPSDIIHLPATVNTPGHFQLMIGRQLNMVPIPKALHDLLSISCVAPSRTFSHKSAS